MEKKTFFVLMPIKWKSRRPNKHGYNTSSIKRIARETTKKKKKKEAKKTVQL